MTRAKKIVATVALVIGTTAVAASPALANNSMPVTPLDNSMPVTPLDNSMPVTPLNNSMP
ncbi:hypothetical protein AB0I00_40625 [Streptomyces sp. NPDC050803]|uniref:hypothetical protein n=1 Tax=unclassified Streptomyces TaxID=2593676 RepID=UPI00343942D1